MSANAVRKLIGAGLLMAGAAGADQPAKITTLVSGTQHDALFSIGMLGRIGVAVGGNGEILESADAGETWKAVVPAPTSMALLSVSLQPGHAIVVGQSGLILFMDATGKWTAADAGTGKRLFGVSVNQGGVAAAVGAFGTILRSADGGGHWASIAPRWDRFTPGGEDPHLYCVAVDDAGAITVAGEFGLILRSEDAGKSWRALHKGDASIFAIEIRPDGTGYAVGQSGTVLRTSDKGVTWRELRTDTGAILLGVHSSGDRVLITGMHEMLASRDGGSTWHRAGDEQINTTWVQAAAGTAESQSMLVVGAAGRILKVDD
jgi:photosystem II stability/assembly factor-like uncharacterized protein